MKRPKNLPLVLVVICLSSCLWNDTAITEDLGDKYFYLGAGNESQILLGNEKKNSGVTVVPQEVIEYNYDTRYIIARSTDSLDKYWIIDKQSNQSLKPLDSLEFAKEMENLNIALKLKVRK